MNDIHFIPHGTAGGWNKHAGWEERPYTEDPARHLGLVKAVVRRMGRWGMCDYEDVFQAGCLGVIKASKTFDPERGFKFSTYAAPWIFSYAQRALQNEKIQRGMARNEKQRMVRRVVVMNLPEVWHAYGARDGDAEYEPQERTPWEPSEENPREIEAAFNGEMTRREQIIIHGRVVEERTLQDLADEFGVTHERIRQIEAKAFRKAKTRWSKIEARRRMGVA